MTAEVAHIAWRLDELVAVERAVSLVLADVHRTTLWLPEVTVTDFEGRTTGIMVEGHVRAPATAADPMDEPDVVCDVAGIVQEDLCEAYGEVWPMCAHHVMELHPEVHEGRALWWCRRGSHGIAMVGHLGA